MGPRYSFAHQPLAVRATPIIEFNDAVMADLSTEQGPNTMPGTLHIFRLKAEPLQYQINYNLGANSWVQVMEPDRLEEFLQLAAALPDEEIQDMMSELRTDGHTTEANVDIGESHLGEMGFAESPTEE